MHFIAYILEGLGVRAELRQEGIAVVDLGEGLAQLVMIVKWINTLSLLDAFLDSLLLPVFTLFINYKLI